MSGHVDVLVAGAQKSGTKAFRHMLSQHPEIGLSLDKFEETHFFSKHYQEFTPGDYSFYHQLFAPEALSRVTVDVTPVYIFMDGCLERAKLYNPDMKVIVILRDPVSRAYSQWNMQVARKIETRSFLRALLNEISYWSKREKHIHFSYLQRGLYSRQVAHLYEVFPRENCLCIKHEDLKHNHKAELDKVWSFLGVSKNEVILNKQVHARKYDPMPLILRLALKLFYRRDIKRLERLLAWDCSDWKRLSTSE